MDLGLQKTANVSVKGKASMQDIEFAKHALAVVKVHDALADGEGKTKTLRQLGALDDYIGVRTESLHFHLLCMFGRHAATLYTKFFEAHNITGYEGEVAEIARNIWRKACDK